MSTFWRTASVAFAIVALYVGGCTKNPADAPQHNRRLGTSLATLPTPAGVSDRSILADQAAYRPTGAAGGPKAGGQAAGGDEKTQVQALVDGLVKAVFDYNVDAILGAFDPADIAPLKEASNASAFYDLKEKLQLLETAMTAKLGEGLGPQTKESGKQALIAMLKVEVQDADNATVSIQAPFPIPGQSGPASFPVHRIDDQWKIKLPRPITAEEAAQLVQVVRQAQAGLDTLIEQIDSGKITDAAGLMTALQQAFTGQAPAPGPDAKAGEQPKPEPAEDDSGPAGRRGMPRSPKVRGGEEEPPPKPRPAVLRPVAP